MGKDVKNEYNPTNGYAYIFISILSFEMNPTVLPNTL